MENTISSDVNIIENNNTSPKKTNKIIVSVVVMILIAAASYFLYNKHLINKQNLAEQERQNQIKGFYQKVYDSKDEMMPLTEEEYNLLLINPLIGPDMESEKVINENNITVGLKEFTRSGEIEVAFPYVPNLSENQSVFVRFDSIKDSKGAEIFDVSSAFENENDMFTDLDLDKKNINNIPYLYGTRSLYLTRSIDSKYISEIKGKLVIMLPIGLQELNLGNDDIGVEKPFAGRFITLREIKDDSITVDFTGDINDITKYKGVDKDNNLIDSNGYSCSNKTCNIYIENAKGIRLWGAEKMIKKEIPFTFKQITEAENEGVVSENENKGDTVVNYPVKQSPPDMSITSKEKEDIIKAYFDFKKILDTYDSTKLIEYSKKVYPSKISEINEIYAKDKPTQKEYVQFVDMVKGFFGYDILLSPADVRVLKDSKWIKESPNDISVDVDVFVSPKFRKTDGVWYVHMNDKF